MILKRADIESAPTEFCFTKYLYNCTGRETRPLQYLRFYKEISNQNNYALRITNYALRIKIIPHSEFLIPNLFKYLYPLHIHILRTRH